MDDLSNLINPRHWVDPEPGQPGVLFLFLAVFALVALLVAAYIHWRRRTLFPADGLKIRLAKRGTEVALWLSGAWLFLILMRYANVPYLAAPILFGLTFLGTLACIGYAIYYITIRYPHRRAAYDAQAERARYLPGARRGRPVAGPRERRDRVAPKRH